MSDDTRQMVEEHLRTCDQCREEAVALKQDVVLPASKSVRLAETKVVKGLKRKLFRKKFLISAVSVIITIAILAGIYSYMVMTETCVPYNSGKVQIEEENGALYVVYEGDDLGGTVSFDPMKVNVDGDAGTAARTGTGCTAGNCGQGASPRARAASRASISTPARRLAAAFSSTTAWAW